MSYKIKIILEFEEKPTPKDIIEYINELDEDLNYEIENEWDITTEDSTRIPIYEMIRERKMLW